ncbi:MAG: hypothetical protein ACOYL3_22395 [Desulfuromonadaceae bacterium]
MQDSKKSDVMTTTYCLDESGEFVITDYNSAKLFSSFFPGVAGQNGIPMWTFYVNRGQCICSMGIQDKEHATMEFLSANRAYQLASTQGFRTFIKPLNSKLSYYEPFQKQFRESPVVRTQKMIITPSSLTLEEVNETLGVTFTVGYSNVPQDDYAGLIRTLRITNNRAEPFTLQGLDGLTLVVPYGVTNDSLKFTRRLVEAFVEVVNHDRQAPLFRGRVEPVDRPEVVRIKQGNFYVGFEQDGEQNRLITPIVDPVRIFGSQSDYSYPDRFLTVSADEVVSNQILENRLPCAMGLFATTIEPGNTYTYTSIIGHVASVEALNSMLPRITDPAYAYAKVREDRELIEKLTQGNFICSQEPALDLYTRQNYLDNGLRGGFPITLEGSEKQSTFYLYSRKHGDLERDYNHFSQSPTYYSQGNANYRDVNQNRRSDLFFNPDVRDINIIHFYNLIQLDGFNPLVIKEVYFSPNDPAKLDTLLNSWLGTDPAESARRFFESPFTPGSVMAWLEEQGIALHGTSDAFLGRLIEISDQISETEHGEGFWTDHWTYNLDLLENHGALYPEETHDLLFNKQIFTFYDNAHRVEPRDEKYVLWDGNAMQLNAVVLDAEKEQLISSRPENRNTVRTAEGHGEIYCTTLVCKMLSLVVNKLASLDPEGVGVEMEADKPNWYDALNGLPGILGSSISETLEIKRNILFLQNIFAALAQKEMQLLIYEELREFYDVVNSLLKEKISSFDFWDRATAAKEKYRAATRLGVSGREVILPLHSLQDFFAASLEKLERGIEKAWNSEENILSTYFVNEVIDHTGIKLEDGSSKKNAKGMSCFRAVAFRQRHLPLFLEGPVHYLRTQPERSAACSLVQNIKSSALYDKKLCMYKVNAPLESQPMEIGRARVFSPGWFENESIWLHMEYKYCLELLRNELYDEFFHDFKKVFVPFFNPEVYGRSILENSSFIVSSANPDHSLHGNGFVARLSGATAEFIHMILLMTVGRQPFTINHEKELQLNFKPALPGWLFTEKIRKVRLFREGCWQDIEFSANTFSFMFLGSILVTYNNPARIDTFGPASVSPTSWTIEGPDGKIQTYQANAIKGKTAEEIRSRNIRAIRIDLA